MKKITPQKLSKRLVQYGALTTAMIGVTDINGQIKYTDISDVGGPGQGVGIDLDGLDGFNEFFLLHGSNTAGTQGALYLVPFGSNAALGSIAGPYNLTYPFALNNGDIISAGNINWIAQTGTSASLNYQTMNFVSCYGGTGNSNWCGVTDKYLGLRFELSDGTHYGWARLDVDLTSFNWTLYDFAYNETVDAPINAGQTTLSIEDNALSKVRVVALHKSIGLYNLKAATDYKLYNMTGQEVLEGTTNNYDYVIEATTLASGVYIVELGNTESNAIIRKKVVLQ
ncbi:putative secreted protein (Por secretion system target) [Flavobacteriaceae bacterium MAR_2010_72]|nr:putative secreted protein (Por secretion system target) [Flavobacteriaceae bacterium MAR_2010_72]TVZ58781.1 putative secreted protein (Por secretion system target) [Flavobacteriaceae bacterium MAR_2010_105]